ncbi:MAG: nucleotidyltransferase domain-containing protein [Nanoarchaeota archaeon]
MEFNIHKKNKTSLKENFEKKDIDLAYEFTKNIHKEFGSFVKAIVLFGSKAKHPEKKEGDIDILLVIDDISYYLTAEVVEAYRVIIEKNILKVSKRIHVTTLKFTSFWDYIRIGDPIGLNILRDGVALIDTGFFTPLQMLLYSGKIRPSKESMLFYISKSPQALYNSKWHILQATLDLYWAVIDAAHASLMKINILPPAPTEIAHVLEEKLAKNNLINKKSPKIMKKFYDISKKIIHKELNEISGKEFDNLYKEAEEFVEDMKSFIKK